jgi:hypothetical protein
VYEPAVLTPASPGVSTATPACSPAQTTAGTGPTRRCRATSPRRTLAS